MEHIPIGAMPFKEARPEQRAVSKTEVVAVARNFYTDTQSSSYTTAANTDIQRDLTRHALDLLQPAARSDEVFLLLDIGAGSGLSTAAATSWLHERGIDAFIVAFDVSSSMLALANQSQRSDMYCGNAGHRLPLRAGEFHAAISISMLQWLPPLGLEVCLSSVHALLSSVRQPARAVFQVYPPSIEYVDDMERIATRVGFDYAETFVSFPHATTAKKWFFSVERTASATRSQEREVCVFGRRFHRRCALQWMADNISSEEGSQDGLATARGRLEKEHVKAAWHTWRKYRRAISLKSTGAVLNSKAQRSLELWDSDERIARALELRFIDEGGLDAISYPLLLEHACDVVGIVHSVSCVHRLGFPATAPELTIVCCSKAYSAAARADSSLHRLENIEDTIVR